MKISTKTYIISLPIKAKGLILLRTFLREVNVHHLPVQPQWGAICHCKRITALEIRGKNPTKKFVGRT